MKSYMSLIAVACLLIAPAVLLGRNQNQPESGTELTSVSADAVANEASEGAAGHEPPTK